MWCRWTKKEKGKVYDLERSYGLTNETQNTLLYILTAIRCNRSIFLETSTQQGQCAAWSCVTHFEREQRRSKMCCRTKFKALYHYRPSLTCVCTISDCKVPKRCLSLTCARAQIQIRFYIKCWPNFMHLSKTLNVLMVSVEFDTLLIAVEMYIHATLQWRGQRSVTEQMVETVWFAVLDKTEKEIKNSPTPLLESCGPGCPTLEQGF